MASEEGVPVDLYIYDLSNGIASLLSSALIGETVEGIWHSSIVVYEREYFFGGAGVTSCAPGSTQLGAPHQTQRLGQTFLPYQVFVDYIQGLATSSYTGPSYNLLEHNCNHFTEEVAQFLCGAHIPKHVLRQAEHLPAPLRAALPRLLDAAHSGAQAVNMNGVRRARQESPDYLTLNNQIEQASEEEWVFGGRSLAGRFHRLTAGLASLFRGLLLIRALARRAPPYRHYSRPPF